MSHYETKMLEAVESIALSLSRIANKLCLGHVPDHSAMAPGTVCVTATTEMLDSLRYAKAVQAIVDMPDDIPAPAPQGKPATKEQVVSELNAFSRAKGVAAAKKVLQGYGESLGAVPEEKYADLIAELKVLS